MNQFKDMWEDQEQFNREVISSNVESLSTVDRKQWNNYYALALHKEVSEFLDETNWKIHRGEQPEGIHSNKVEEAVDVFKYWMSLCQVNGISAEEIQEEYYRKSAVVKQRFQQEMIKEFVGTKVVGVDIDGILADYPRSVVDFMNSKMAQELIPEIKGHYFNPSIITSYNIFEDYGLSKEVANKVKHFYRETGYKRFIPAYTDAKLFLDKLKKAGYTIVLVTSRPYKEYTRIFADTMYWLNTHNLQFDVLLWGEDKGKRITEEFPAEDVVFFIDDVPEYANSVACRGIKTYLMNKTYNEGSRLVDGVTRVNTLLDALALQELL